MRNVFFRPVLILPLLLACTTAPDSGDGTCTEDTIVDDGAPYSVTLSFWEGSEVEGDAVPTSTPRQTIEFTWDDNQECFVWIRNVSASLGGGERLNVASQFSLDTSDPDSIVFRYVQNSSSCCDEFNTPGTEKTFYSDRLIEDETTGQTGNPLQVAVTDFRVPQ